MHEHVKLGALLLGYLVAVIVAIAGGAWAAASWAGDRNMQMFNMEYRVGLLEKAKLDDSTRQQIFQDMVNHKLDKIKNVLTCVQIQQSNKNFVCPPDVN